MRDRVTISLYSTETNDLSGYTLGFLEQLDNIEKIRDGLINAAKKAGQSPPEIVISMLLVPNWNREGNSYTDGTYLRKNEEFLVEAKRRFGHDSSGVMVEDFYSAGQMTTEEKAYMHNLKAMGSNADMIKTRAIINNLDRRHLQIDSNTVVPSFEDLYNQTFGASEQKDGINASYYDRRYISAHNKMVYTTPDGDIAKKSDLARHLREWCRNHQDDNNVDQDKQPDKNSIYARVFTEALHTIGYTVKYSAENGKTLYPATLSNKVYWLTDCMLTALNMSWSADGVKTPEELKSLPAIAIGKDGVFNFQCYHNG